MIIFYNYIKKLTNLIKLFNNVSQLPMNFIIVIQLYY